MSEEVARSNEETTAPVAVSLALAGASREEADAFLRHQRHHLNEQLKQIHLDVWEKRLGVLLRVATAFIGVAIAVALGWLFWNAANSNDLVIDSFAVPPELAARGLSGPVVAAKLLDKIATMQAETVSQRPPKSYASSLVDGLKLEIPETGVSLFELDRFLREKLGHDLHIGGEIVQTNNGMALTARVGSYGSATVAGAQADADTLLQKLAEQVYRVTQPYRYALWMQVHGHREESIALLRSLAISGPSDERSWAYNAWGLATGIFQSPYTGQALLRRGHAIDPNNFLLAANIAGIEYRFGQMQGSQRDYGAALKLLQTHGREYADRPSASEHGYRAMVLMYQGALLEAVDQARTANEEGFAGSPRARIAEFLADLHEPGAARAELAEGPLAVPNSPNAGTSFVTALRDRLAIALQAQDWPEALAVDRTLPQMLAQYPGVADNRVTYFDPLVAQALAHIRQFAAAEARLKPMPADCYPCLRARAQVADLQGQDARADWWFARATAIGPSIPYAESEWGRALLDRGKPDEAIGKFKLSNAEGPHFADPLEGWGEALMAKNQSHLALAKFAEANKYAPNWGRLHLKWGEALAYAGKKDEAKAQFARAAELDLTPSEKAELTRVPHG
jgi:tetratricopeptide (TPR) repeat protein